jgi:hypothetical protein
MKDFLHRTISTETVEYIGANGFRTEMSATRTRTSDGFSSIVVKFGDQKIEFNSDKGDGYDEDAAREMARMLEEIADNPCQLPSIEAE